MRKALLILLSAFIAQIASASEIALEEIVVTAQKRVDWLDFTDSGNPPGIFLQKRGDFLLYKITLINDSISKDNRTVELENTVAGLVDKSSKTKGISLGFGTDKITAITKNSYKNRLSINHGYGREMSSVKLFVKASIDKNDRVEDLEASLKAFAESVKLEGRTLLKASDIELSVVGIQRYRNELIEKIADDIAMVTKTLGKGYRASISGLSSEIVWERASKDTLKLYLPYSYSIVPEGSGVILR